MKKVMQNRFTVTCISQSNSNNNIIIEVLAGDVSLCLRALVISKQDE